MEILKKVVLQIPLSELWTSVEILPHKRIRNLTKAHIREIIKVRQIEFVFADVGHSLISSDKKNCYRIWKEDVEKHVVEPGMKIDLDNYPDNYGYVASEWTAAGSLSIVLLEKIH